MNLLPINSRSLEGLEVSFESVGDSTACDRLRQEGYGPAETGWVAISQLKENRGDPGRNNREKFEQECVELNTAIWVTKIFDAIDVSPNGVVLDGHHRLDLLRSWEEKFVPIILWSNQRSGEE